MSYIFDSMTFYTIS